MNSDEGASNSIAKFVRELQQRSSATVEVKPLGQRDCARIILPATSFTVASDPRDGTFSVTLDIEGEKVGASEAVMRGMLWDLFEIEIEFGDNIDVILAIGRLFASKTPKKCDVRAYFLGYWAGHEDGRKVKSRL